MEQYCVSYRNQSLQSKTNHRLLYEMQHYCRILESIETNMNIDTTWVKTNKKN